MIFDNMQAVQVIEMISNEWIELSHDKIKLQRDDHIRWCNQWLDLNKDNVTVTMPRDKWEAVVKALDWVHAYHSEKTNEND